MRSFAIVSITKYNSDNEIMNDVMGEACSTCGVEERLHSGFWWGNLKEKRPLGRPGRK